MNNEYNEIKLELLNITDIEDFLAKVGQEKFDKVFAKAWDNGHSGGYSEIKGELFDLIEVCDIVLEK